MGDETPAADTLQRLMGEGLTRHDAIHAIAWVLAAHVFVILKQKHGDADPNQRYFERLRALTADAWLRQALEDDEEDDDG